MPSRKRLGRDPDREAAPLLQRPVVLWPVADLVARPGDLVAARFIGLVGHRSSGERGSGPIRPTVALPKPRVAILHQRPFTADGAYDQESVYADVAERHPGADIVVPPRSTVPSATAETAPTQRDRHLQLIAEKGRMGWQKASGYNARA